MEIDPKEYEAFKKKNAVEPAIKGLDLSKYLGAPTPKEEPSKKDSPSFSIDPKEYEAFKKEGDSEIDLKGLNISKYLGATTSEADVSEKPKEEKSKFKIDKKEFEEFKKATTPHKLTGRLAQEMGPYGIKPSDMPDILSLGQKKKVNEFFTKTVPEYLKENVVKPWLGTRPEGKDILLPKQLGGKRELMKWGKDGYAVRSLFEDMDEKYFEIASKMSRGAEGSIKKYEKSGDKINAALGQAIVDSPIGAGITKTYLAASSVLESLAEFVESATTLEGLAMWVATDGLFKSAQGYWRAGEAAQGALGKYLVKGTKADLFAPAKSVVKNIKRFPKWVNEFEILKNKYPKIYDFFKKYRTQRPLTKKDHAAAMEELPKFKESVEAMTGQELTPEVNKFKDSIRRARATGKDLDDIGNEVISGELNLDDIPENVVQKNMDEVASFFDEKAAIKRPSNGTRQATVLPKRGNLTSGTEKITVRLKDKYPARGEVNPNDLLFKDDIPDIKDFGIKRGPSEKARISRAVRELNKSFGTFYVPKKFKGKADAYFESLTKDIWEKAANRLSTTPHEFGHRLSELMFGVGLPKGKFLKAPTILRNYADELARLAYPAARKKGMPTRISEGFAEFVRHFLVNPTKARKIAPEFYEEFLKRLDDVPEIKHALGRFQRTIYNFIESEDKLGSMISSKTTAQKIKEKTIGTAETTKTAWDKFRHHLDNDLAYLKKQEKILGGVKNVSDSPAEIARIHLRGIGSSLESLLSVGVTDKQGNILTKSLRSIYKGVDDVDKFGKYCIGRTMLYRANQDASRGEIMRELVSRNMHYEDLVREVSRLENPTFKKAYEEQSDFLFELLKQRLSRDTKRFANEELARIKGKHEEYFPLFKEQNISDSSVTKKSGQKSIELSRYKGWSGRDYADPIESLTKYMHTINSIGERGYALGKLVSWARKTPGSGAVVRRIQKPTRAAQIPEAKFEEIVKALGKDLDKVEIEKLSREFFTSGTLKDNQFIHWIDGKETEAWEFADEYIKDIYFPNSYIDNKPLRILTDVLQYPTRIKRQTATTWNLPFIMAKNPMRDQLQAMIATKGKPLKVPRDTLKAFNDLRAFEKAGVPDLTKGMIDFYHLPNRDVAEFKMFLGSNSGWFGAEKDHFNQAIAKLSDPEKFYLKHPVLAMEDFGSLIEDATRFGEFRRLKWDVYKPMVDRGEITYQEALLRSIRGDQEITVDFKIKGKTGRWINKFAMFYNAGKEDISRVIRLHKYAPQRTITRGLGLITAPSMALWGINKDDEIYQNMPWWRRTLFFNIPFGRLYEEMTGKQRPWWMPYYFPYIKPFTLGWIYGTIPEETANFLYRKYKGDKRLGHEFYNLGKSFSETIVPEHIPDMFANYAAWHSHEDTFRGMNFESRSDKMDLPEERYSPRTSETAKFAGRLTKTSPKVIEGLVRSTLPGAGTQALGALDYLGAAGRKAGLLPEDTFTKLPHEAKGIPLTYHDSVLNSKSLNDLFEKFEYVQQARTSLKRLKKKDEKGKRERLEGEYAQALDKYNTISQAFRKVTKKLHKRKKIDFDKTMTKEEKNKEIMEIERKINEIVTNALIDYDDWGD